ncbi:MAG: hypothetical protein JSW14_07990 [Candidatus Bathyarchaeum sp.]|nr:MAG: hypothetical protein JSW14_07990 [Candidatus Bathyarchaeum sp.]
MTEKRLGIMALCILLLTLLFSGVDRLAAEETRSVYYLEYGGLVIDIWAPDQAYPGESINVTVKTEAAMQQPIYIKYINVDFYGVENTTTEVTLDQIVHLENSSLTFHEVKYNITIPDSISTGLTYGEISCEWDFMGAPQKIPPSGFALTYVKDTALEELQADYDELNATYHSTLEDYNQLESKHQGEVDSTRNLMYVFIATTVVAAITVGVLLLRKPKKVYV